MEKIKRDLIAKLSEEMSEIFGQNGGRELKSSRKDDQSFVTEIDLFVSGFIKKSLSENRNYCHYHYFSEEDVGTFHFPCAIVDPIDGTRELVKGRAECAVSLALMHSPSLCDPLNYAWIYNPFTGFSLDSKMPFVVAHNLSTQFIAGMVSRSEFHHGLFDQMTNRKIHISPRGSIAFKLGLLASGACDFVVSKYPKNVWDIAAGTLLLHQRGFHFYLNGKRVDSLDQERYEGTLIWAKECQIDELLAEFQK